MNHPINTCLEAQRKCHVNSLIMRISPIVLRKDIHTRDSHLMTTSHPVAHCLFYRKSCECVFGPVIPKSRFKPLGPIPQPKTLD